MVWDERQKPGTNGGVSRKAERPAGSILRQNLSDRWA